jgi:type IX secretion system PorP/SprF family membrane protein
MKILISQKILLFTSIIATTVTISYAQDVHFSQIEYSPLFLNPALSGANSTINGVLNYRSQWNSVAIPYKTMAASIDGRFNDNKRKKKGIIAGGISFFNDQAGDLKITSNSVNVNLAYHLMLDESNKIGLGISTGFGQRSIDPNGGRWTSQYNGTVYNSSLPSNEVLNIPSFSFFDAGAGILYSHQRDKHASVKSNFSNINIGLAAYHLNRPSNSFLNQTDDKLYVRWTAFVNSTISIPNSKGSILPGIYFQKQGPAMEILYGLYYKNQLSSRNSGGIHQPTAFSIGLFNRFKDAMAIKFMYELGPYAAGFCYDLNISSLNEISKTRGGFEFFLRFNLAEK